MMMLPLLLDLFRDLKQTSRGKNSKQSINRNIIISLAGCKRGASRLACGSTLCAVVLSCVVEEKAAAQEIMFTRQ